MRIHWTLATAVLVVGWSTADRVEECLLTPEIQRISGRINNQMKIVESTAKKCNRGCKDPREITFRSIITKQLRWDVCDLVTESVEITNGLEATCPQCSPHTQDCSVQPKDVIIILDESGSISNAQFESTLDFLYDLAGTFDLSPNAVRLAMVTFGNTATLHFNLDTYISDVTGARDKIAGIAKSHPMASTFTNLAFQLVSSAIVGQAADRPQADNTIILLTDGESIDPKTTLIEFSNFDQAKNEFFIVAIGTSINKTELEIIADKPLQDHLFYSTFDALMTLMGVLKDVTCDACDPVCENGGTCDRTKNKCKCTKGYFDYRCEYEYDCSRC